MITVAAVAAAHEVGRSDVDAGDVVELTEIDCPPRPLLGIIGARRCSHVAIDSGRRRRYVPAQLTGGFATSQISCHTTHIQPFNGPIVRDNPSRLLPEETFTHSHPS